jgi:hypothetical protein
MADEDLIEAEGNIAFNNASMFGDADETPEAEGFGSVVTDDESEAYLLDEYASVRPFGKTWEFDFSTGQFVHRGNGAMVSEVDERAAFAQWCMNVLHTERLTAVVYSDQIGVEFESLVRSAGGAEIATALLYSRVDEALRVHDRYAGIVAFEARVEGDIVHVAMTINTTEGAVDVAGSIAA